jgi:hypothetical protein
MIGMPLNVVPFELPRPVAIELIRRLAREGLFVQEPEFRRKLRDRGFTIRQVMDVLYGGSINQGPWKDDYGDWRFRLKRRSSGRLVRVALAIHDMRILYLISVY